MSQLTPEQQNILLAFQAAKADIKSVRVDIAGIKNDKAKGINTPFATRDVSGVLTIDLAGSDNQLIPVSLVGNTTLSLANAAPGKSLVIVITQGGAGNFTFTLPAECKIPSGMVFDLGLTAGNVTALNLLVVSAGYIITTSVRM